MGEKCEEKSPCTPNPCKNNGICYIKDNIARCVCIFGFDGEKCEDTTLILCPSPNVCKNGGTCYLMKNNSICKCTDQYFGDSCQDYNYCEPNLCKYDGTCSSLNGGFQCLQEEYDENKNENSVYFNETVTRYTNATFNVFFDQFVISFDILLTTNNIYILTFEQDSTTFLSFIEMGIIYLVIDGFKNKVQINISTYAWNSLKLTQHYSSSDNTYNTSLYLNGTLISSFSNLQPKVFTDITLHVFKNCYNNVCTFGSIKNLNIISKTQVFWSQWSEWSSCNASVVKRTRICNSNQWLNCTGDSNEAHSCSNDLCQESWAQWGDWSSCNDFNGKVSMNRSRECNDLNFIDCCSGSRFDVQTCYEWSTWSDCSSTCGDGYRTKSSLDKGINGVTKTEYCKIINCPVDGLWGDWNSSLCSTTCGSGKIYYKRGCDKPPAHNGKSCIGVNYYIEDCSHEKICPVDGFWYNWSLWSLCNQPCRGGFMSRFRRCSTTKFGGQYCKENSIELVDCPSRPCKKVDLNLLVYFVDVQYQSDYFNSTTFASSNLRKIIRNAIANLYSSFDKNITFNVELHSMSIL
nr:hemicentin-1 [Hydra vulgaris]